LITGVRGVLETKGADWVQVRIGGSVTLQIFVPPSTTEDLGAVGGEVHLHTHLYIRDDEAVLYGFSTPEALRVFQLLNSVGGVGPRMSLGLISSLGSQGVVTAVATGDVETLCRAPGVGRKSAGRMVLELSGKLEKELADAPALAGGTEDGDVLSALMALGYSVAESRRAVASMGDAGGLEVEEKIRRALQQLSG
jgi:Holliday junction DNA helicase RuvA